MGMAVKHHPSGYPSFCTSDSLSSILRTIPLLFMWFVNIFLNSISYLPSLSHELPLEQYLSCGEKHMNLGR